MASANISFDISSLYNKTKDFLTKLDLKESKQQAILGGIGLGLSGLCLYLLYSNNRTKKEILMKELERIEVLKEEKEKVVQNHSKSSSIKNISNIKSSNILKGSIKNSKLYEEEPVHKLPEKKNFTTKLKEKNMFRDYTSFEEDIECDSMSTKEEKLIYTRRRVASYSTDNEFDSRGIKAKRHQILSMAKESNPSDQLFFKLYANLSNDNDA